MPFSEQALQRELAEGLSAFDLECSAESLEKLLTYLALLSKWNHAYNLTAIKEPQQMLRLHLLDSLSIASYLQGDRFIDVGTGAGLPGLVLAILFPAKHFTLLDSNGKKIRFLFQARSELGLKNVSEINHRVERYHPPQLFDGVISRAFTSLSQMLNQCNHLLTDKGQFYAMKGQYPDQELSELPKEYKVVASPQLQVPGVEADRHLIVIEGQH